MERTTFESAGAGSGKTYYLSQTIVKLIKEKKCRANQIILCTYTDAAAGELSNRVRAALYKAGLFEDAVLLDNAAIGTIHSIALQFITKYWYLVGLSADVKILADDQEYIFYDQALSKIVKESDLKLFNTVARGLNVKKTRSTQYDFDFWKSDLKAIVGKMNELCLDATALEESKRESMEYLLYLLGTNGNLSVDRERVLAIREFAEVAYEESSQSNKNNFKPKLFDFRGWNGNDVSELPFVATTQLMNAFVSKLPDKYDKKYPTHRAEFEKFGKELLKSVDYYNLVSRYVERLFELAKEWKDEYVKFKAENRLIDYNDMQHYLLELLSQEQVVAELKGRYTVALVDEFQDCSPMQIRCFDRLSELMNESYLVGDMKQAIYGFRGSDTVLVQEVIDKINSGENGNKLAPPLEHCWRSNESIVNQTSDFFCNVFAPNIAENNVRLTMPKREDGQEPPKNRKPEYWQYKNIEDIISHIDGLCRSGKFAYKDFAILCKENDDIVNFAQKCDSLGIPCNPLARAMVTNDTSNRMWSAMGAIVSLLAHPSDGFYRALVARYFEKGYDVAKVISDRVEFLAQEDHSATKWLSDVGVVEKICGMVQRLSRMSVVTAMESLVVELRLSDLLKRVSHTAPTEEYCALLIDAAKTYESECSLLGIGTSMTGFAFNLRDNEHPAAGDSEGITITTYHKSKGLEWKCVVLTSLDKGYNKDLKIIRGVHSMRNSSGGYDLLFVPGGVVATNALPQDRVEEILEDKKCYKPLQDKEKEELKRVLYVGMTRPKELLVLAAHIGSKSVDRLWRLEDVAGEVFQHQTAGEINYCGLKLESQGAVGVAQEDSDESPRTNYSVLKTTVEQGDYMPKYVSPSKSTPSDAYTFDPSLTSFGGRVEIKQTNGNDALLGDCIHQLMCLYDESADFDSVIARVTAEYGVVVDPAALMAQIGNFWRWMTENYGAPEKVERELPFSHRRSNGQVVSGEIDLLWYTESGDVLVDYKTFQGSPAELTKEGKFCVSKYSGQIALYEEALLAAKRSVRDRLICYLSLGLIARFTC